jgi:formylglycine-generating enzyme
MSKPDSPSTTRMPVKPSAQAAVFDKVLRAFDTGGFTYAEFRTQLKRLLASGVAPTEMLEVLRRHETVKPLPEFAHVEVLEILEEAAARAPAPDKEVAIDLNQVEQRGEQRTSRTEGAGTRASAAPGSELASTLSAVSDFIRPSGAESPALNEKVRAAEQRIAQQNAAHEALTRTHEQSKAAETAAAARAAALVVDLAAARGALESEQSRSRKIAQVAAEKAALAEAARLRGEDALRESQRAQSETRQFREALAVRDTQLTALQQEHAKLARAAEARGKTSTQLEAELHAVRERAAALAAELVAARGALESEQSNSRKIAQMAAEKSASAEAARSRGEDAQRESQRFQAESRLLRESLAAREAQFEALQQEHAKMLPALEARARAEAELETELRAARARAESIASQLEASQQAAAALDAQRKRGESDLMAAESELHAVKTQSNSYLELLRTREWHGGLDRDLPQPSDGQRELTDVAPPPPPPVLRRAQRILGWTVAALVLVVIVWFFLRPAPVATPVPVAKSVPAPIIPGTVIRDCPTCPFLTVLPAGRFKQGLAGDAGGSAFERPLHWVLIARPLAMSTNAVTVDEFRQFISATGRDMQGCDTYDGEWKHRPKNNWAAPGFAQTATQPVTCVSWQDAEAYAGWLSSTTGHHYRLPSASEWEYAARAAGDAVQPWKPDGAGACANANVADASAAHRYPGWSVFPCDDGYVYTAPVGSFKANAFGLNDMLGNVLQWTDDCWHADYNGAPVDGSARTDGACAERELRGGSWFTNPAYVRASYRNHFAADYRTNSVGIRLVRDIEQ